MSSFSYLQLWFQVNKMQEFLIDYLHPMFRTYKGIPEQGELSMDWVDSEWKI